MENQWFAVAALATALVVPLRLRAEPSMPAFQAEIRPFVGTWKRTHEDPKKKKTVTLYLVIKQEKGELRIRYQLPVQYKKYTSDWYGSIELQLQVSMQEKREVVFVLDPKTPSIITTERIHFTGSPHSPRFDLTADYTLSDDAKTLIYSCQSIKSSKDDKPGRCPLPMEWTRVSDETKWPD